MDILRNAKYSTSAPQAGSYLFPELPSLDVTPEAFVRLFRFQAGVTVTLGAEFGSNSSDSIRLNFSQIHNNAVSAARRIVDMVERYRA